MNKKSAIIIPAYQPDTNLLSLVNDLHSLFTNDPIYIDDIPNVIIIDDGSSLIESKAIFTKLISEPNVHVLRHSSNLGKGAALKTGIKYAKNENISFIITADADGQHTAKDIKAVLEHTVKNNCFCIGTRSFKKNVPWRSKIGNNITKTLFDLLLGLKLNDTQSGLRGIPSIYYETLLNIQHDRYQFEFEALILAAKYGRLDEVNIQTIYEPGNPTSHFRPLLDSTLIYLVLARYSFVSIFITAIDITGFLVLSSTYDPHHSFIITRIITTTLYFSLMKTLVFNAKKNTLKQLALIIPLVTLNTLYSKYIISSLKISPNQELITLYGLATILIFFFNFIIQKQFIFKTTRPS